MDQIVNDKVYLSSDTLLFAETWTKSLHNLCIPGFDEVARVDVDGAISKAYGSICFLNRSSLIIGAHNSFSKNYIDNNGHHLSLSSFVISNIMVASIYISPRFSRPKRIEFLQEILSMEPLTKIIAGDFNTDFKQTSEPNSITDLYSALPPSIISTTNNGTYIDNIFTNIQNVDAGRYISFTSHHDPLLLHFHL
jgi:hypothetical protein